MLRKSYLLSRWLGRFLPFGSVTYPGMLLHLHGKNHSKPATPAGLKFYESGPKTPPVFMRKPRSPS